MQGLLFLSRRSYRITTSICLGWGAWCALVLWMFRNQLSWHISEALKHMPPGIRPILGPAVGVCVAVLGLWLWVRHRWGWRWEFLVVLALPAAVAAIRAPGACAAAGLAVLICFAAGDFVLERCGTLSQKPIERLAAGLAAGLGLAAFLLFWAGLAGLLQLWTVWTAAFAILAALHRRVAHFFRLLLQLHVRWGTEPALRTPAAGLAVCFWLACAIAGLLMALAPATAFDSLKMHLPEARYYAEHHRLAPLPLLRESYFPQGFEILMSWLWLLGGQSAAQLAAPVFWLTAQAGLFALLRRAGVGAVAAVCGAVAAGCIPFAHWTGWIPKNDLPVACYQIAALLCWVKWKRNEGWRHLAAGAGFLALSFSVKHVALFGAVGMAPLFAYALFRDRRRWHVLAASALVFAVLGLHWHVRAYADTGNPLYPASLDTAGKPAFQRGADPAGGKGGIAWVAQAFWWLHFNGKIGFESPSQTPLGMALILFLPAWVLGWRLPGKSITFALALFAALAYIYWIQTFPVLRYAIPCLFVATGLTVAKAAEWLTETGRTKGNALLAVLIGLALTYSTLIVVLFEASLPRLLFYAGRLERHEFLAQHLPSYRALQAAAGLARSGDKIATFDDCASVYAYDPGNHLCFMKMDELASGLDAASFFLRDRFPLILLPLNARGDAVKDRINQRGSASEILRAGDYAVYRIRDSEDTYNRR